MIAVVVMVMATVMMDMAVVQPTAVNKPMFPPILMFRQPMVDVSQVDMDVHLLDPAGCTAPFNPPASNVPCVSHSPGHQMFVVAVVLLPCCLSSWPMNTTAGNSMVTKVLPFNRISAAMIPPMMWVKVMKNEAVVVANWNKHCSDKHHCLEQAD